MKRHIIKSANATLFRIRTLLTEKIFVSRYAQKNTLRDAVEEKLKLVLDPELGVSIVDLGLIYTIIVSKETCVITMTLTTIGCPLFAQIQKEIEDRVLEIQSIEEVKIELTFDPPWTPDKMSPEAKIQLGLN